MHKLVGSPPSDMPLEQWEPLYTTAVSYKPDLILELGRGWGNSTCVLTEAAHSIRAKTISVSFDTGEVWTTLTAPRLLKHVGPKWFKRLTVIQADITQVDFRPLVGKARRVMVFWDAHGLDVGEAVVGNLLPLLPRGSLILVDDVFLKSPSTVNAPYLKGPLASTYEEIIPVWDYLSSRGIAFEQTQGWISFTLS